MYLLHGMAGQNTPVQPVAVGHVLFLLFWIFFPNIITPEEKLGCSEKRWMMQYSANPIMYVLVKCVATPPPPLNFCEAFITLHKQDWPRVAEKPWRLCGKEWRVIRLCYGLEWVEEELRMWTFEQVFTFNSHATPSAFAGHGAVLQPLQRAAQRQLWTALSAFHSKEVRGFVAFLRNMEKYVTPPPLRAWCWVVVLMQDKPHVDRRMDDGKFCKFNRWANYWRVCADVSGCSVAQFVRISLAYPPTYIHASSSRRSSAASKTRGRCRIMF